MRKNINVDNFIYCRHHITSSKKKIYGGRCMGIKEAKNQMVKLLSVAPNKCMSWDSIKDLLMSSGFPKSTNL